MIPPAQSATAALLRGLAGCDPLETHISAVFVGADTVWKLRKAVRLPFLDFSTLAERERTARRELALNAPHAPGLYRDVVPVVRGTDGALVLGGAGETVDWVVRMARVPEADFFDTIAARGRLEPWLHGIADAVAALHVAAPVQRIDGVAAQRAVTLGDARSARAAGLPDAEVAIWTAAMMAELDRRADWLAQRGAGGFIRRVHGDLHLGNICLWQGKPVPFDALEFDEAMAVTDVAYDLAFLLMDLQHKSGRAAANRVLCRYVARTGDWALVAGLPLFLSQRAMVRAHVQAARGQAADAAAYLAMAQAYLRPAPPLVVAVGGLQGTGKSTLARALAPDLGAAPGALVLRSDEIRKRQHGVAPEARLPDSAYTPAASHAVFAELFTAVAAVAQAGHAVVADAMFFGPADRDAVQAAAGAVPFCGLWLHAALAELERRIAARAHDASDATVDVLRRTAAADAGPVRWRIIDADDGSVALAQCRATISNCMMSGTPVAQRSEPHADP